MWQKIKLYIISLGFLFILLFINKIPYCFIGECNFVGFYKLFTEHVVATFCLVFITLGTYFYWRFNYKFVKGATTLPKTIKRVEDLNFETLSFFITYVIPLMCFDLDFNLDAGRNFLMLILVLILIGWIYVKTNIFYTNPTLAILGYRIYKIDTETTQNIVVIVKEKLKEGDNIYTKLIDENIYFATKSQNE